MRAGAVLLAALLLAAAAAAARLEGSDRGELLLGTRAGDVVRARGGDDRIVAWGDARRDVISCGGGTDLVNAERADRVSSDCETLVRQLARDRTQAPGAQAGTIVEPDSHAAGRTVVTVFQSGRFRDGGAAAVGFATSRDGGESWVEGRLPSSPRYARQSDPVVGFDAAHGVWLASTLGIQPGLGTALLISRSADGLTWEGPVEAAVGRLDKQWLVCDNGAASPYRGRCYLAYTDVGSKAITVQSSTDGATTWSPPVSAPPSALGAVGAYPVVRPNGDVVVLYTDADTGIAVVRSTDGAATLRRPERVQPLAAAEAPGLRAPALPSADVGADGSVLAVWASCAFWAGCGGNDVLLSTSEDGVTWTQPRRLPTRATGSAFVPALAVAPDGRVAVLYYTASGCPRCRVDAWVVESAGAGRWTRPLRLSARSMRSAWMAQTGQGAMLADYVSVSWVAGRPLAVLALAEEPLPGGTLRQAVFAATRLDPSRSVRSRPGARRS